MTEADIAVIVAAGGSIAAGAWQTLKSAAMFMAPRLDRLIEATEATAKSTAEHTAQLADLRVSNEKHAIEFKAFTDDHSDAKTKAFENHARIERLAQEAVDLCKEILEEVKK